MLLILIVNLIIKIKSLLAFSAKPSQQGSGSIPLQITYWCAVRNKCLGAEFRAAPFSFHQDNLSFLLLRRRGRQPQHEQRLNPGWALLSSRICSGASVPRESIKEEEGGSYHGQHLLIMDSMIPFCAQLSVLFATAPLRACWSQ